MTLPLDTITAARLADGLDLALARQQVAAANIANANVAGYVTHRVSVDPSWTRAMEGAATRHAVVAPALDAQGHVQPVQLDAELAEMSAAQLRYSVLIKDSNRHLGLLSLAISDGKR